MYARWDCEGLLVHCYHRSGNEGSHTKLLLYAVIMGGSVGAMLVGVGALGSVTAGLAWLTVCVGGCFLFNRNCKAAHQRWREEFVSSGALRAMGTFVDECSKRGIRVCDFPRKTMDELTNSELAVWAELTAIRVKERQRQEEVQRCDKKLENAVGVLAPTNTINQSR